MPTPLLPGQRPPTGDWRDSLKRLAPAMDRRTASVAAAILLSAHGDHAGAEAVFREVIKRRPHDLIALRGLAQTLNFTGSMEDVFQMRRCALAAEATAMGLQGEEQAATTSYFFAAEGAQERPPVAPPGYIIRTFDQYEDFDDALVNKLQYRTQATCEPLVQELLRPAPDSLRILDLGCGTGLTGAAFRDLARELHGVDLSPRMIERARGKDLYDSLEVQELCTAMETSAQRYDLILAADVFIYLGDLERCLQGAARVLAPGGSLCFSLETCTGESYALGGTRRYSHSRKYLEDVAASAGLSVVVRSSSPRLENAVPVEGLLVVAQRLLP